jgi:hypothetical protein
MEENHIFTKVRHSNGTHSNPQFFNNLENRKANDLT